MVRSLALGFNQYGTIDVFEEQLIDVNLSEKTDVLVKVERVSVNPVDISIRKGAMAKNKVPKNFRILGNELQGEIVELKNPDTSFKIGDKVMAIIPSRADAEYVATSVERIFKVPETMPLDLAAGFPMVATTAYWTLDPYFYDFKQKDTLAIVGASGNVGSLILQLARRKDISIIAVGSKKNEDYLKHLGADIVLDYRNKEQVAQYSQSANYVINASLFNSGEELALSLLKPNGTYLGLNSLPDLVSRPDVKAFFMEKAKHMTDKKAMADLTNFYNQYGLELKIGHILPFSLDGIKEAHQLIETKKNNGKVILKMN